MKFDICFATDEIQLTLKESLKLPGGKLEPRESLPVPSDADLLQQIEVLARQFLERLVMDRGGSV